jgi:ribosomal protein L22
MSAEEEKEIEVPADPEASEEPKAAKKPAGKKAPAAKKAAPEKKVAAESESPAEKEAAVEDKPERDGQQATLKAPAKAKRAAKKAVESKAAAPGDGEEAKEAAKAQDAAKPAKKVARRAAAGIKGPPTRRKVVRAQARYVRTSARKARMVCGHLRGKSIPEARAILAFTPREVARDWSKLLESAVANAENNHELLEDDLVVREAYADEGPTIKRFRPRAMGRATPIRKRTSHLTITLTPDA